MTNRAGVRLQPVIISGMNLVCRKPRTLGGWERPLLVKFENLGGSGKLPEQQGRRISRDEYSATPLSERKPSLQKPNGANCRVASPSTNLPVKAGTHSESTGMFGARRYASKSCAAQQCGDVRWQLEIMPLASETHIDEKHRLVPHTTTLTERRKHG